jgi:hypothetical protein
MALTHRPAGAVLAFAIVLSAGQLAAQSILSPSDRALVRGMVADISRANLQRGLDAFAPLDRISGGPGEAAAVRYLAGELDRLGIPYKVHTLRLFLSWPVKASLTVNGTTLAAVTPSFSISTPASGVTGVPVLFASAGHVYSGADRNERAVDVRGKVAVIEGLVVPQDVEAAERAGAVAVVNVNSTDLLHEMIATPIWGTPGVEELGRLPKIPILSVTKTGGEQVREAAAKGTAVTVYTELSTGWKEAPMVIAEVRGASDEFVLLSSHLDAWYAGMTDTGGSNISLLEFARLLHGRRGELKRSLWIVWWVGHSTGRYGGSTWLADTYWEELDSRCVGYVNLDGPGTKGVPLDRASVWAWPELFNWVDALAREVTGAAPIYEYFAERPTRIRPARAGDASFQGLGIPEYSLGVAELPADHPDRLPYTGGSQGAWWWHTRDDTVDKLDMNVIVKDIEWRLPSLVGLLNATVLPYRLSNTARHYRVALDEYATDRFDLSRTRKLVDELEQVALQLEGRYLSAGAAAPRVNAALLRASHLLNATLYTTAGRFHQDPAYSHPLLPSLAVLRELRTLAPGSSREGFVRASALRGRNRVDDTLRQAIAVLREVA